MYRVAAHHYQDQDRIVPFMDAHPFAMLIASGATWPAVTQVPVLIQKRGDKLLLRGHIMKKTDHHEALVQNPNALFVFTGAHSYVSAGWYTNPAVASTWNYQTVQARAHISFLDEAGLYEVLKETTERFEQKGTPGAFENIPESYVRHHMKAVVGFEAEVVQLDAIFKLSQKQDTDSYANIIKHLNTGDAGAQAVAEAMSKIRE